ncbi:MAG: lipocalin-like domain-containing protein [Hyphomonadaceae bacterium]
MRVGLVVMAAIATACSPASSPPSDLLVGTWRLVRYVDTPEGGQPTFAFGERPAGYFVFTADGLASISFTHPSPGPDAAPADPDPDACVPAWYCSYFGSYTTDGRSWTVHVEGGNIPSMIDTDQTRSYVLNGDTLTLAGAYDGADGKPVRFERVLQRRHPN